MQEGFEIGEVLGSVEEGVADEGDAGAFGDIERQAGFDGGRSLWPGSCLLVDGVLCQARILDDGFFPRFAIPAVRGVRLLFFRLPAGFVLCPCFRGPGEIQVRADLHEGEQQAGDEGYQEESDEFHGSGFRGWS